MQHSTSILYLIMGHYSLDMSLVSVLLDIEHHYNHTFVFCIKESLFVQCNGLLICKPNTVVKLLLYYFVKVARSPPCSLHCLHCLGLTGGFEGSTLIAATRAQTRTLTANQRPGMAGTDQSQAGAGHGQALEPSPGAEAAAHEARGCDATIRSHKTLRGRAGQLGP